MDELVYWTSRSMGKGNVKAWVYRGECPKCGKGIMGKPVEKGKVKVRAKYYECPECGYKVDKQEYEDSLTANIVYTCPECGNKGETQIPFRRKKFQGVDALVFQCEKCKAKVPVTKKMKEI